MEPDSGEIAKLEQATEKLQAHAKDLLAAWEQPLTFRDVTNFYNDGCIQGTSVKGDKENWNVATGILWIPGPFASHDWIPLRKPKPKQCSCPTCGKKHAVGRGVVQNG